MLPRERSSNNNNSSSKTSTKIGQNTHTRATVRLTREISFFKNHSQRRKYFIQVCYTLFSLSFEIMLLLLLPMPLLLVHSFSMIHVQLLLFARSIFLWSTIFSIFKVQNFGSPHMLPKQFLFEYIIL